jgi:hypothetical protein
VIRAMLFADIKGFARLTDDQLRRFSQHVGGKAKARQGNLIKFCCQLHARAPDVAPHERMNTERTN